MLQWQLSIFTKSERLHGPDRNAWRARFWPVGCMLDTPDLVNADHTAECSSWLRSNGDYLSWCIESETRTQFLDLSVCLILMSRSSFTFPSMLVTHCRNCATRVTQHVRTVWRPVCPELLVGLVKTDVQRVTFLRRRQCISALCSLECLVVTVIFGWPAVNLLSLWKPVVYEGMGLGSSDLFKFWERNNTHTYTHTTV